MQALKVRKGDNVLVIKGKEAGKITVVERVLPKKNAVILSDTNKVLRHTKANPYAKQAGGRIEKLMPLNVANVMVICQACGNPTRIGYRYKEENGKRVKVRFCKRCKEEFERSSR